jgi:hypothetical protein
MKMYNINKILIRKLKMMKNIYQNYVRKIKLRIMIMTNIQSGEV